eukprot:CAMPEP_0195525010 /NCGR_PEP_ID=MMETSP0794_2-20130614/25193_1 /TAXON_ID=515487 /ORGANISM="Stephanopyxis turris, Strain CCMP 815" /LENGTH=316 /DNA_ID=CAMNT_0040655361 /DNA_START=38 /DNA_END=988 /DNA_ORIENTATION=+
MTVERYSKMNVDEKISDEKKIEDQRPCKKPRDEEPEKDTNTTPLDPFGLLQSNLIANAAAAAAEAASTNEKKRRVRHLTEEQRREERLAANRRSAAESRKRKKELIDDLQKSLATLAKRNADLAKQNEELRSQLQMEKVMMTSRQHPQPQKFGLGIPAEHVAGSTIDATVPLDGSSQIGQGLPYSLMQQQQQQVAVSAPANVPNLFPATESAAGTILPGQPLQSDTASQSQFFSQQLPAADGTAQIKQVINAISSKDQEVLQGMSWDQLVALARTAVPAQDQVINAIPPNDQDALKGMSWDQLVALTRALPARDGN